MLVVFLFTLSSSLLTLTSGHGVMTVPTPRQPEAMFWYQVGCLAGCTCTGAGKEMYPSVASMNCQTPIEPSILAAERTWNTEAMSPKQDWNKYMPWRAPGTSIPLDSCGIASGFLPGDGVQYPHNFKDPSVKQGDKGTALKYKSSTTWAPGATVQAAFTLNVNHGGGYQYRVCPYAEGKAMTEDCFANHPLKFADSSHTVRFVGGSNDIQIAAVDVTAGVVPKGAAWRRIPLPSCNCDLGTFCNADNTANNDVKAYKSAKAYGDCTTGLQFEAKHLTDKSWPAGYGYYVGALNGGTEHKNTVKDDGCSTNKGETACTKVSGCAWYAAKSSCYTAKGKDACGDSKDETACANAAGCAWAGSKGKNVCYASGGKKRNLYVAPTVDVAHTWEIVDKLIAPTEKGDYILQWRWDNEQTPQIWTTCSDITVGDMEESLGDVGNRRLPSSMINVLFVAVVAAIFF